MSGLGAASFRQLAQRDWPHSQLDADVARNLGHRCDLDGLRGLANASQGSAKFSQNPAILTQHVLAAQRLNGAPTPRASVEDEGPSE